MAKRRWLFRYLGVFLLICLGAISTIFSPMPCTGSESGEKLATFSLEVDQQPLGEVLQEISKATGYEITVDKEYAKQPITVSLKNVTVEEGLRRILGKLSRYLVIDEAEKKISVRIVDAEVRKTTATSSQKKIDPLDVEVTPPQEPGERGITQRELDEMNKSQANIDPRDLEVIPPQEPGGRGITQRELEEINKSQANTDRRDLEVIPPERRRGNRDDSEGTGRP